MSHRATYRQQPATIEARIDRIRKYAEQHGWHGDTAMGRAFGMSRQATWAVMSGTNRPSIQFIAGVLRSSTDARFDDLFTVVEIPTDAKEK